MVNHPAASGNARTGVQHAVLQNKPAWSIDHAYSIGHTVDDSGRGIVPSLDTEEYPSVDKAVKALNAGTVSCPNGMCVVRSERQKLYFLVVRSDKLHESANVARDVFNIKNAEQPFLGDIDTSASGRQDHKPVLLGVPATGPQKELVKASDQEPSLEAENNAASNGWKPLRDKIFAAMMPGSTNRQ